MSRDVDDQPVHYYRSECSLSAAAVVLVVLVVALALVIYRAWPETLLRRRDRLIHGRRHGRISAPRSRRLMSGSKPESERPKPEGPIAICFASGPVRPPRRQRRRQPRRRRPGRRCDRAPAATVPPIPLKFVGTMKVGGRLMACSRRQWTGPVYGFEGDTVLGQYRLVRVGADAVEMAYLDGRGQQTIRFSGS